MTVMDILEQVKQLKLDELEELTEQILDLRIHRKQQAHKAKTGAELVVMLKKMGPIELVDPEIEDPVEWLEAQRQKEADRLKPYWDGDK
ncbi:MAG TPA: hypothetical protein PLZ51_13460 [Aggregatilineales bacterium]|nr:hypothetical protein [Aggregatilineales bacterium]